jgi:hypothetical protein
MDWREKVTAEKSLFEVYQKAQKVGSSRSNFAVGVIIFICFILIGSLDFWLCLGLFPMGALGKLVSQVSDIGFALTTAILGFLIAGFSIFSTITRPEIFAALAKLDHKDSGLSQLQFIFFNFLLVFVHFLAFLAASIVLKIGLPFAPTFVRAAGSFWEFPHTALWWTVVAFSAALLAWLAYLIMLLKSFIWNIYQAVLVVIVTGDLIVQIEKDQRGREEKTPDQTS